MPDWTHTLDARQRGFLPGFLATDLPLEEQDEALGGPRAETPAEEATAAAEGEARKAAKAQKAESA
jgi:hypothetical protein